MLKHRHQEGMLQCSFYIQLPIAGSNKTMPPRRCKVHTEFRCPSCTHIACHEHRIHDETGNVLCINCYQKGNKAPGTSMIRGKSRKPKRTKRGKSVEQVLEQRRTIRQEQEQLLFYKGTQWEQYRMFHAKQVGTCPTCRKDQTLLLRKGFLRKLCCYSCYLKKPNKRHKKRFMLFG